MQDMARIASEFNVGKQLSEMLSLVSAAEDKAKLYVSRLGSIKSKLQEELSLVEKNTQVKFIKEDVPAKKSRSVSTNKQQPKKEVSSKKQKVEEGQKSPKHIP